MTTSILIIISTLVLSAFFSGMEIAYVSSNKIGIEIDKKQGGILSSILKRLTRKPSKFITTVLLCNNIVVVVYGFYMSDLLLHLLTPDHPVGNAFINYWLTDGLIITKTFISALVILITAEFIPKTFFQIYANTMLKVFAIPAYIFYVLVNFLSSFVIWLSNIILKLFFKTEGDEVQQAFTKVELGNYISERIDTSDTQKEIDSEVLIFKNALEFSDIKAREVMVPRPEIIAVEIDETPKILRDKIIQTGLSKIIIYRDNIDDIIGYIHSFELFKKPEDLKSILLPVIYVPEIMPAKDVLNALLKKHKSIAVVIDEYGGTSGIMTIEDIVEEIFGEIEDEHDATQLVEEKIGDNQYKFSARTEIDYINENYTLNLPKSDDYETLGGLIVFHTEDIPEKGGIIAIEGYRLKALEVSETKIELVLIECIDNDANK